MPAGELVYAWFVMEGLDMPSAQLQLWEASIN
jgi:hypothetical protein